MSHIYKIETESRPRRLPFVDGIEWQWVLYRRGILAADKWEGSSPFMFSTKENANNDAERRIRERHDK